MGVLQNKPIKNHIDHPERAWRMWFFCKGQYGVPAVHHQPVMILNSEIKLPKDTPVRLTGFQFSLRKSPLKKFLHRAKAIPLLFPVGQEFV